MNLIFGDMGMTLTNDTMSMDDRLSALTSTISELCPAVMTYITEQVLHNIKEFINMPYRE